VHLCLAILFFLLLLLLLLLLRFNNQSASTATPASHGYCIARNFKNCDYERTDGWDR
jgi:hypothetical protein